MFPVTFDESDRMLTGTEDIGDLPIWTDNEQCISCWKVSLRERLSVLFFGTVWVAVKSGHTQPPMALTAMRKCFRDA